MPAARYPVAAAHCWLLDLCSYSLHPEAKAHSLKASIHSISMISAPSPYDDVMKKACCVQKARTASICNASALSAHAAMPVKDNLPCTQSSAESERKSMGTKPTAGPWLNPSRSRQVAACSPEALSYKGQRWRLTDSWLGN